MARIGALLIILGFGSLILDSMNRGFRLLSWADDMQPGFGIVLGIVGVLLVGGHFMLENKKKAKVDGQQATGEWAGNGQWAGAAPQVAGQPTGQQHAQTFGGPPTAPAGPSAQGAPWPAQGAPNRYAPPPNQPFNAQQPAQRAPVQPGQPQEGPGFNGAQP